MDCSQKFKIRLAALILFLAIAPALARCEESSPSLDRMINQIESMFPLTEGYVVSVEGPTLFLDLKQGEPLHQGDRLKLIRFGEEMIHPVTGEKVGRKETDLGEVEILEVRKDFSLARATDPAVQARSGDGVRSPFKKLSFLVAPPVVTGKMKVDKDRLRLDLEQRLNQHPRFQVPAFELGLWMLENGVDNAALVQPSNLNALRQKSQSDYILVPNVRSVKNQTVLSYELFSTLDGSLVKEARILTDRLPAMPAPQRPREEEVQSRFDEKEGMLKYTGKQEFAFEIVDLDVGDVNGDGKPDFVVIDANRVMIYNYEDGNFKKVAQIKADNSGYRFLGVDVGDINGNGRDEIFITNQYGDKLSSFVLEIPPNSKKFQTVWKDANHYFRVIHPFDAKPVLLSQDPGFEDPIHGPIRIIQADQKGYTQGSELKLPSIYGTEWILYGMLQAPLNSGKNPDTILLDKDYYLRVYSPSGRLLVKSDDYYGHDPRLIEVGVKTDASGIAPQGKPVRYRGRLELVKNGDERFLIIPRNHRMGGAFLEKMVVIENSDLVILRVTAEGFSKAYETKKQKGYLAAYHAVKKPDGSGLQVHAVIVDDNGSGKSKKISTIFTYDWQRQGGELHGK